VAVLQKATAAPSGGNGWDRILLALAHAELRQADDAGKWANAAVAWLAKEEDKTLWQFVAEELSGLLTHQPQPDSVEARVGRGRAYNALQQPDKALAEATRAVDLQPEHRAARELRTKLCLDLKKWSEALADCTKLLALASDDARLLELHGNLSARCGQWAPAAADFEKLIELKALDKQRPWLPFYRAALAHRMASNTTAYRQMCTRMLERFQDTTDWQTAFFTAWTCVLAPDAGTDLAPALKLAAKALALEPNKPQCHQAVGAVLYRMGRLEASVQHFVAAEAANKGDGLTSPAYWYCFLAMAHHRLGHKDEAAVWLDKARAWIETELPVEEANGDVQRWVRTPTLRLLRAELEAQLRGSSPPRGE
jgi:tetratricopeptide (TPR) repeat protein